MIVSVCFELRLNHFLKKRFTFLDNYICLIVSVLWSVEADQKVHVDSLWEIKDRLSLLVQR